MSPSAVPTGRTRTADDASGVSLVDSLSQELVRLSREIHSLRSHLAALAPAGVEWSTYVLLFHLVKGGPQRSGALAACVNVDPSTVSRQIAQLVRLELAERRPDPVDGRACLLAATTAGKRIHRAVREQRDEVITRVLEDWHPDQVVALRDLLGRFNDDFGVVRPSLTGAQPPVCDPPAPSHAPSAVTR